MKNILVLFFACFYISIIQSDSIWDLEGFGTDADFTYYSEEVATNQKQIANLLKSHTRLRLSSKNGTISLSKQISISNLTNVIIEGPVTILNNGIVIAYSSNIMVRNLRILNAEIDGILVTHSSNVVIDHCTILDASRLSVQKGKCIDLTESSNNLTVSNSIIGYTSSIDLLIKYKGMLIAHFLANPVNNVSLHHNIFYCNYQRNPQISTTGPFHMQQNIIFNYTEYGTRIRNGATGNFINNQYIGGKKDPIVFEDLPNLQIYSHMNSWKFNGTIWKNIDDIINHPIFVTPKITPKTFLNTINIAGCLLRQKYEVMISNEIRQFLNYDS